MSANQAMQEALDALKENRVAPEGEEQNIEAAPEETNEDAVTDVINEEEVNKDESLAVERPHSWSKENAEIWDQLTPEAKQVVSKREGEAQSELSKGFDQNAVKSKDLDSQLETVKQQRTKYLDLLESKGPRKPSADMLDPEHESYDTDAYHLGMAKFEKSQEEIRSVTKEVDADIEAEAVAWQTKEVENYKQIFPEYLKKPELRTELAKFAMNEFGFTGEEVQQNFKRIPAKEMSILNDAMLYRRAKAKVKAGGHIPKPKTMSGGSSNPTAPKKTDTTKASAKFMKDRSPQAAADLMAEHRKKRAS